MNSGEDRRKLILRSAVESIVHNGFHGVRLRDVSRRAGVSVGMIQHYFDTREELVSQAIGHLSDDLVTQFFRSQDHPESGWARITAMIDQLCAVPDLVEHSQMWLTFGGAVFRHPELRPALERVYLAWDAYVRDAVDLGTQTGELHPVGTVDDVVATFLAFFDGYEYDMSTGLLAADRDDLRRRAQLLARALFQPTGIDVPQ